jgi:uncharacterized membrane protein YhhN
VRRERFHLSLWLAGIVAFFWTFNRLSRILGQLTLPVAIFVLAIYVLYYWRWIRRTWPRR